MNKSSYIALFKKISYANTMIVDRKLNDQVVVEESFTVYMLRTSSDTLYIGQTNNLERRLKEHKNKTAKSAKYMKYFDSFVLVYTESYATRKEAMQREWELKQWTKAKKEALIYT